VNDPMPRTGDRLALALIVALIVGIAVVCVAAG
jgi:hypothetical protein